MVPPPSKPAAVQSLRAVATAARLALHDIEGTTERSLAAVRDHLRRAAPDLETVTVSSGRTMVGAERSALGDVLSSIDTAIAHLTELIDSEHEWAGDILERQTPVARSRQPRRPAPHKIVIAGDTVLAGTVHMANPHDPRSVGLRKVLHEWRERTDGQPRRLLIEGGRRDKVGDDEDDAMSREGGEMAWAAWVGHEFGIEMRSLEERLPDQVRGRAADHDPDVVFTYYVMRQIPQVLRLPEPHRPALQPHFRQTVTRFHAAVPAAPGRAEEAAMERFTRTFTQLYPEKTFASHFTERDEHFLLREAVDQASGGP